MKKTIAIILTLVLALSLAACGGADSGKTKVSVFWYDESDVYLSSVRTALNAELDKLENDVRDLRNVVARNSRKVDAMRPLVCLKAPTCNLRADINIVTEEEQG